MKKTAIDYETLNSAELTKTKDALTAQCSNIDVTGSRDIDILLAKKKKYNENQILINRMDSFREYEMNTSFSGIPEDQYPSKDEYDREPEARKENDEILKEYPLVKFLSGRL